MTITKHQWLATLGIAVLAIALPVGVYLHWFTVDSVLSPIPYFIYGSIVALFVWGFKDRIEKAFKRQIEEKNDLPFRVSISDSGWHQTKPRRTVSTRITLVIAIAGASAVAVGIIVAFMNVHSSPMYTSDYLIKPIVKNESESFQTTLNGVAEPNQIVVDISVDQFGLVHQSYYQGTTRMFHIMRLEFNQTVAIKNPSNASSDLYRISTPVYSQNFAQVTMNYIAVSLSSGDPKQDNAYSWNGTHLIVNRTSFDAYKPINVTFTYFDSVPDHRLILGYEHLNSPYESYGLSRNNFTMNNTESVPITVRTIRLYQLDQPITLLNTTKFYVNGELIPMRFGFTYLAPFTTISPHAMSNIRISFLFAQPKSLYP